MLALSWLYGACGDFFKGAEGFIDCFRIGEGIEEIGGDEDNVGALLHALEVLAANPLAEVERRAGSERIEVFSFLHIVQSRLRSRGGL